MADTPNATGQPRLMWAVKCRLKVTSWVTLVISPSIRAERKDFCDHEIPSHRRSDRSVRPVQGARCDVQRNSHGRPFLSLFRMSGNVCVTLGTAAAAVVMLVTGCTHNTARQLESAQTPGPPPSSIITVTPPSAPLPPPEALTDVLARLADPAVPGSDKLNLVQGSTSEAAAALDRFTNAARDGGYLPMTFTANNVAWSATDPSCVTATVVVTTANPERREFTFPMEFTPTQGGWQLSRKTAEMLLALQTSRSSTASSPSSPAPAPPPSSAPATPAPTSPSPEAGTAPTPSPTP